MALKVPETDALLDKVGAATVAQAVDETVWEALCDADAVSRLLAGALMEAVIRAVRERLLTGVAEGMEDELAHSVPLPSGVTDTLLQREGLPLDVLELDRDGVGHRGAAVRIRVVVRIRGVVRIQRLERREARGEARRRRRRGGGGVQRCGKERDTRETLERGRGDGVG